MPQARYFLPDHTRLTEVYSKTELRGLLQSGELSRSDMVCDDETGLAHFLGDLLAMPYPEVTVAPTRSTSSSIPAPVESPEFRAHTPLHEPEPAEPAELEDEDEDLEAMEFAEEEFDEDLDEPQATPLPPVLTPEPEYLPGEEALLYVGHPSWLSYPKGLFLCAVLLIGAVYAYQKNYGLEWLTLLGSVAGLILLFISLDRTTTTYYITTRRVEMEFGIVGRNTKEVRICDIRAIDVIQEGYPALVGIGNVNFDSSASAGVEVRFKDVRNPHKIKEIVRELQG